VLILKKGGIFLYWKRATLYRKEDTVVVTGHLLMAWVSDRVPRSSSAWVVQLVFPSALESQQQPEPLKIMKWNVFMLINWHPTPLFLVGIQLWLSVHADPSYRQITDYIQLIIQTLMDENTSNKAAVWVNCSLWAESQKRIYLLIYLFFIYFCDIYKVKLKS